MFCCLFYFWFNWRYFLQCWLWFFPSHKLCCFICYSLIQRAFYKVSTLRAISHPNWFQINLFIINFNFDCKLWKDYFKRCLTYSYSYYYVWRFNNGYFIVISPLYQVWLWQWYPLSHCQMGILPTWLPFIRYFWSSSYLPLLVTRILVKKLKFVHRCHQNFYSWRVIEWPPKTVKNAAPSGSEASSVIKMLIRV